MKRFLCTRPLCAVCSFFLSALFISALIVIRFPEVSRIVFIPAITVLFISVILLIISAVRFRGAPWLGEERKRLICFSRRVLAFGLLAAISATVSAGFCFGIIPNGLERRYAGGERRIEFTIRDVIANRSGASFYSIEVTSVDGERVSFNAELDVFSECDLSCGDTGEGLGEFGRIKPWDNSVLSGLVSASGGRSLVFTPDSEGVRKTGFRSTPEAFFGGLRKKLSSVAGLRVSKASGGLVRAITVGDDSFLSASERSDFRALGISHIVVISGMHLSVIIGMLAFFLNKTRLGRIRRGIILFAAVGVYVMLSGCGNSVIRAAIMTAFVYSAPSFGRTSDGVTSLCASVSLICVVSPSSVADVGLILSFLSTLGILTLGMKLGERVRRLGDRLLDREFSSALTACAVPMLVGFAEFFLSVSAVSLSAFAFSFPFSAVCFGTVSLLFLPANIVFVPLTTVLLFICPFIFLGGFAAPLGRLAGILASAVSETILFLAHKLAGLSGGGINVSAHSLLLSFAALLPIAALIGLARHYAPTRLAHLRRFLPRWAALAVAFAISFCGICAAGAALRYGASELCYISEGENEGLLISGGGETVFVDIGDGSGDITDYAVQKSGEGIGGGAPTAIFLTHLHSRHYSTVGAVLTKNRIKRLFLPKAASGNESDVSSALSALARDCGTEVIYFESGEANPIGDFSLTVFRSESTESGEHTSVSLGVDFSSTDLLLLSGAGRDNGQGITGGGTEAAFIPDYVILSSHPPRMSRPTAFVGAPVAVISAGIRLFSLNSALFSKDTEKILVSPDEQTGIGVWILGIN